MREVYVQSIGFWSPGYANAAAWCGGPVSSEAKKPPVELLRGPLRRRATSQTRSAVEVLGQVLQQARWDGSRVSTIWGTAHGEHATSISMFEWMCRGEGKLSPTQFHNSVHNTAGGYASIAQKNTATSTTLTGAGELVVSGFVEAAGLLQEGQDEVALVFFDEPLRPPFAVPGMEASLAIGFGLSIHTDGALARLGTFRREAEKGVHPAENFSGVHVAAAIPLLENLASRRSGLVPLQLETEDSPVWCTDLEIVGD